MRLRYNGVAATLQGPLTASVTTISFTGVLTHAGGSPVPTIGAGDYLPLSLLDSAGRLREVVWLVAYNVGANTGTIQRAREGTTATTHTAGGLAVVAPSVQDLSIPGLVSTGSPEGVVAAGVGTRYVDTDATFGAVAWVKATGSASTGWQVVYGDTGWRDISSLLINGWTGTVLVSRSTVGGLVYRMVDVSGAAATSSVLLVSPAGFRPSVTGAGSTGRPRTTVSTTSGTVVVRPSNLLGSGLQVNGSVGTSDLLSGDLVAGPASSPPWPTVLPGVAA